MAYDEELTQRFRDAMVEVDPKYLVTEKSMMGGVCLFVDGKMLGGADRTSEGEPRFMFRVGKEREDQALKWPGVIPVVLGKRRMGGMVFVEADQCSDQQLVDWVGLALEFVGELPAKP